MPLLATEVPEDLVKAGRMFNLWASKLKIGVVLVVLALYIYVLLIVKTTYMRSRRLDSIENMALQNEELISKVLRVDEALGKRVDQLTDFYEDY